MIIKEKFAKHEWAPPLFIMGASRSGTAMLRSILVKNKSISLVGETHYFDDLRPKFAGKTIEQMSNSEIELCCDYFRAQTSRPYGKKGNPNESWLSRDELMSVAQEIGNSVDSIFEAYCKLSAWRDGAQVWGEKTPRHIFRIPDILQAYPNARIICMVRDPRAVVASYRDWKYQGGLNKADNADYEKAIAEDEARTRQSYHLVLAAMMWRGAANAAFKAKMNFNSDHIKITKYEDVTNNTEKTVSDLCNWLDVEFTPEMLNIPLHNSSAIKFTDSAGVSKVPQHRWRKVLSQNEVGIVQQVAGSSLSKAGYEKEEISLSVFYAIKAYLTLPFSIIRAAHANRSRYDSLPKYLIRRAKAAFS